MERLPDEVSKPLFLSIDVLSRSNFQIWNHYSTWKKIHIFYMIPCVIVFFIGNALYTINMFSRDVSLSEVAYQISIFLIIIQATVKGILLIPKKKKIAELIEKLGATWTKGNLNEQQIRSKKFIFKRMDFCLKTFRYTYVYIGIEILMVTLCALLSAEFAILRDDFRQIEPESEETNNTALKNLVQKHQQLLMYTQLLDAIFNKILFFDLLFVTGIMCLFGFGATVAGGVVELVNDFFSVIALLLPVLIFCYFSEQVKEECVGIAEAAYDNKWYQGSESYKRIIRFVIIRAQEPCCLTSMGYAPITLNTFSRVVSTTWSYFSLIRTVFSED
ncbi:putative odorant receptor 92a isoform X2 [Pieris brassicae]|uniref:putative odorant receptor 92a isoform X2 n=1 Tax=Pieris brassicae TaxID=7116 RepID=UPI001E660EEA|nr:putative odorant receptor 92a isoform X2 [Pieris brassicae]